MTISYEASETCPPQPSHRPGVWHLANISMDGRPMLFTSPVFLLGSAPQFSQLLVVSDKLRVATIHADQQGRKCPDRGRHKILGTGEVDVKFRREEALID